MSTSTMDQIDADGPAMGRRPDRGGRIRCYRFRLGCDRGGRVCRTGGTVCTSQRRGAQHLRAGPSVPGGDSRVDASVAERRDLGRARRSVMPRSALAEFIPPQNRPDPVRLAGVAGGVADQRTWCRCVTAGCCIAIRVLPRRGADHGVRLGFQPAHRTHRAAVWRRACVELRPVRVARAKPGLRHQRLRRDTAGPVGVGRQAAGGECGDRRSGERLWS